MRKLFYVWVLVLIGINILFFVFFRDLLWNLFITLPITIIGFYDVFQKKHTIRRNFPVIGHFRYIFEAIRPEINQYFVESNTDGTPFNRESRSIVYQRSKNEVDTLPFGTQKDVYAIGYEWMNHSLRPTHVDPNSLRITVGGNKCKLPYSASIFNISAMSFGALSKNAIMALNHGAKLGNFFHNTGEGGVSPYHLKYQGDLVWQIGTGYFGCRSANGGFSPSLFKEIAVVDQIKMIEIKLSQGAKPSHGGILPGKKVTEEIAQIRGVKKGKDVISPPAHSAFKNPVELLDFIEELRTLSGGKPVGFKLCLGQPFEFVSIVKAMIRENKYPDFITIDGGEGGTGAAPLEFSNSVGFPLREGLVFIRNILVGFGIRDKIKIFASGKTVTAFDIILKLCLGADGCNAARSMMLALGCIQALRCNTNNCPTGIATQNPTLMHGLDVSNKAMRIKNYYKDTLKVVAELMGAMGVSHVEELTPKLIYTRKDPYTILSLDHCYQFLSANQLHNKNTVPEWFKKLDAITSPDSFFPSDIPRYELNTESIRAL